MINYIQLYELIDDPEAYWIINDYCLENNWAVPESMTAHVFDIWQKYRGGVKYTPGLKIPWSFSGIPVWRMSRSFYQYCSFSGNVLRSYGKEAIKS